MAKEAIPKYCHTKKAETHMLQVLVTATRNLAFILLKMAKLCFHANFCAAVIILALVLFG